VAGVGTNPQFDPVYQADISDGFAVGVVAAGAGTTTIKAAAGRVCRVVITTAGTSGNLSLYDGGASGTLLAVIPGTTANATVGLLGTSLTLNMPFYTSLVAVGAANSPGVSLSYV
jgi:hypothetical protein